MKVKDIKKVSDFFIRIVMMFMTLVAILFFGTFYSQHKFTFTIIALLYILALTIRGISDFFDKDE